MTVPTLPTLPTVPSAVLLDAGGVFVLPDPSRVLGAFARAECDVDPSVLTAAHYRAAARFTTDIDVETGWAEVWLGYLQAAAGAAIGVRAGSGSWVRSVSGRDEAGWTSLREVLLGPPVRRRGGIR